MPEKDGQDSKPDRAAATVAKAKAATESMVQTTARAFGDLMRSVTEKQYVTEKQNDKHGRLASSGSTAAQLLPAELAESEVAIAVSKTALQALGKVDKRLLLVGGFAVVAGAGLYALYQWNANRRRGRRKPPEAGSGGKAVTAGDPATKTEGPVSIPDATYAINGSQ